MSAHRSMLQLDAISLGVGDESTAAHVKACARCAAHVARVQQELPVPAWARELGPARGGRPRGRTWLYRWSLVATVLVAGGAVFVGVKPRSDFDRGAKGAPSIAVYIKRDGAVSLWDGQAPVRAGDAVQLKVAAVGYSQVTVSALQEGMLTQLYAGPASGEALLPGSWTVDDAPGPEIVLVAFSRSPLTKAGQEAALATLPRTREVWATRLQLVKKGGHR